MHTTVAALENKLKGKRSKQHQDDVLKLRQRLGESEDRYQALKEETRLRHHANLESIAMLSQMLEETQTELESCKSAGADGRHERRRTLLKQLSLSLDDDDGPEAAAAGP